MTEYVAPKIILVNRGLIYNNGKFLLIKRSSIGSGANQWELPGGKMDKGETLKQNLLREIKEETGLTPKIIKIGIEVQDEFGKLEKYKDDLVVTVVSLLKSQKTKVKLSEEHNEYGWFRLKDIPQIPMLRENSLNSIKEISKSAYFKALVSKSKTRSRPKR